MLAQLPPVSYLSRWQRGNSAPPPSPAPAGTAAAAPPAAQGQASPGGGAAQAGSNGAATAGGAAHAAGPGYGAHPKPVAAALKPGERQAGRLKSLRLKAERKAIRQQLRTGQMTLAQVLARDDQAAGGMRGMTVLKALPGVGKATAPKLLREAGIDPGHLVRGLTAGQRERLAAAVTAVNPELADEASPARTSRLPSWSRLPGRSR